ncbi:MAG: transcriptional regulator [Cocleimonas sp.]|jgi:transcriptional regulator
MFIPKTFKISDEEEIHSFIQANAFGQLISNKDGRLICSHIPILVSSDKTKLIGHLAKINPQADDISNEEVLITLQGAHDYISPAWYTGPGVPTWNYQAVHIYGKCQTFNEPEALKDVVVSLTAKYESGFDEPWQPNYKAAMLGAIVGFEVTISDIQAQYKLSQNKSDQDRKQVIEALESLGSTDLAKAMKRV